MFVSPGVSRLRHGVLPPCCVVFSVYDVKVEGFVLKVEFQNLKA